MDKLKVWSLLFFLTISLFINFSWGLPDDKLAIFGTGAATSIFASLICILYLSGFESKERRKVTKALTNLNNRKETDKTIVDAIRNEFMQFSHIQKHFAHIGRNQDMGEFFWLNAIEDLGTTTEQVWFFGYRMSEWHKSIPYKTGLRTKFKDRFNNIILQRDVSTKNNFLTNMILVDINWLAKWGKFFSGIISEVIDEIQPQDKKKYKTLIWNSISFYQVNEENVKYSLVLCNDKLVITMLSCTGAVNDTPTLEIHKDSDIRKFFENDIAVIMEKSSNISKQITSRT